MGEHVVGAHKGLHSDEGARKGEHPGRSRNPIIKVHDVAWLEFEKPDLAGAEAFAHAFGFTTVLRTDEELQLRGSDAGPPCPVIRRGSSARFVGPTFAAADNSDVHRLAEATGASVLALPETLGGTAVDLVDPSGLRVRVAYGMHQLPALPAQELHVFNFGHELARTTTLEPSSTTSSITRADKPRTQVQQQYSLHSPRHRAVRPSS